MVDGGAVTADKTEFTECFKTVWMNPYIMKLALTAGLGGLLFGWDTGNISGAMLFIKDDFSSVKKSTVLQEAIVSTAVGGAIVGAGLGGWMNDKFGRRLTILCADVLFFLGALIMALAPSPGVILLGRIFVGLGVGAASMTAPLYISEASPAKIRGALVATNGLLITSGQFVAYLVNLAFNNVHGQWRWMLGIAGVPAALQFIFMITLPESPRWLYSQGKIDEARAILEKIYPANEVETEMNLLKSSVEEEKEMASSIGESTGAKLVNAFKNKVVRRGLYAGVTVQVAQQFVGINTVMYYAPTIVQFAGFASKKTALALSLITSGLNALGTVVSMFFIDRYGRRRLMLVSMVGIIASLVVLSVVFLEASRQAPALIFAESSHFAANSTCPAYVSARNPSAWDCMSCVKAKCGFCSNSASEHLPGACLISDKEHEHECRGSESKRQWFEEGCPSKIGFLAVVLMGVYIICYAPGMGTVPWIVNSEIYPLKYRGIGGGIAAMSNWTSNLIVSMSFLSIRESFGSFGAFLLFAAISTVGLVFIFFLVPETKGMRFEEIEKVLERGYRPSISIFKRKPESVEESSHV